MSKFCTFFVIASLCFSVFAAETENSSKSDWYVSPLGSYIKSDQSRNTEDSGTNLKFGIGKELTESFNLELGINGNWLNRAQDPYLKQLGLELDAMYFFNRDNVFSPYIATGVGVLDTSTSADSNPTWSAGFGLLTEIDFLKKAKLRTEVRFQQEYDSGNYIHDDVLLRAGVQIPFGRSPNPSTRTRIKDSDGDGINDDADNCPNTLNGIMVDSKGCDAVSYDVSTENLTNPCPETQTNTEINSIACEPKTDSDKDGIRDSKDQCPNSALNAQIDYKGCEIIDVISLPGINFETNSTTLSVESSRTLAGAVSTLLKYNTIQAEIAGHTDNIGSSTYNLALSNARAKAVLDHLVAHGISSSRLVSAGYGDTNPISDNSTNQGRTQNRRVELVIIK